MKSIRMHGVANLAALSMMMLAAAACTAGSEEWSEGEDELVATDRQELATDGQVCITVQRGTSGQVEDAVLWATGGNWNDGANERISSGTSAAGGYSRSLLRFDLSAVPAGATVMSADLTLTQLYKNGPSATVDVLRATGAWSESTVTWNNFGNAVDSTPVASFTAVGNGGSGARTVDVSDLVQDWVDGTPNYGLAIDAPTDTGRSEFRSSENPVAAERPALSLCYTTCNDGVQNGDETGVDCGGPACGACGVSGSFTYSASYTNYASQNTTDVPVTLQAGSTIAVGTCGLAGAWASGDTFIRLAGPSGDVAVNDDNCGSLSSYLTYTATVSGTYTIRAGCYSSNSCSGNVVYTTY